MMRTMMHTTGMVVWGRQMFSLHDTGLLCVNSLYDRAVLTLTKWSSPGLSMARASSASYLIILNLVG